MKRMYFTITGCNYYFGNEFMKKGMKVRLIKEPDNEFDSEAIMVQMKGIGKVGYVANSPHTVKGESMSAGRLYDKIDRKAKGKILFVIPGGAICKVTKPFTDEDSGDDDWKQIEEDCNFYTDDNGDVVYTDGKIDSVEDKDDNGVEDIEKFDDIFS